MCQARRWKMVKNDDWGEASIWKTSLRRQTPWKQATFRPQDQGLLRIGRRFKIDGCCEPEAKTSCEEQATRCLRRDCDQAVEDLIILNLFWNQWILVNLRTNRPAQSRTKRRSGTRSKSLSKAIWSRLVSNRPTVRTLALCMIGRVLWCGQLLRLLGYWGRRIWGLWSSQSCPGHQRLALR